MISSLFSPLSLTVSDLNIAQQVIRSFSRWRPFITLVAIVCDDTAGNAQGSCGHDSCGGRMDDWD